jgi:glucose-6-phosphate dehydrogenase assembly protein OpcA
MGTTTAGTIAPEKILRELAEMWTAMGKDAGGEGEGALRACSLTLVTLAEESEDFSALGEIIAALMPEHPARTIVVRLRGAGERMLTERVYSQCWRPFGQKRQVCCEQVEIVASDAALADLPSVILPLAVADLPVVVWCRSPRVLAMPEFADLAAMAQRVILDGEALPTAREAFAKVTALSQIKSNTGQPIYVGDLAWTRLTRWRAMLSQVFENRGHLAQLPCTTTVTVTVNGEPSVGPWYFGAWVMDVLADIGIHPEFRMKNSADAPHGELQSIELTAPEWSAELARYNDRLIVTACGLAQCSPLRPATDYSLMEEELRIMGRDPVFERALVSAQRLAGAAE